MDKRKENGGHSTKAKGIDKRKNQYQELLERATNEDEIVKVIQTLKEKAIEDGDMQAIKLFLEYYLGKPKETIEQTNINIDAKDLDEEEIKKIKTALENAY
jgi:hypothetical protein